MRGSSNLCQFYLVLSLFYSLQRGSNGFIAEKLYLYFTKDPEGSIISKGGGVQMLISIETHISTCYFPRWGVRDTYLPLDPHMGNVIITGRYLS